MCSDKASYKLALHPEPTRAPLVPRAGDHLVVTKLDRLGRSLERLIDRPWSSSSVATAIALLILFLARMGADHWRGSSKLTGMT